MSQDTFGGSESPQQPETPSLQLPSAIAPSTPPSQSDYGDFPSFTSLDAAPKDKPSDSRTDDLATTPTEDGSETIQSEPIMAQMPPPPKPPIAPNPHMTSEEYNAQLLSDPRMRNSSVVNPDFIHQYYRESRLHHLSTWKADLKAQLQAATKDKAQSRVTRKKPAPGARRYVLHVDFDSFFAAVSILKHPDLKDKPVAIAHGPGSGSEIASCNYVARSSGIKNGMWMKGALEACPELQVLPYDFPAYEEASRKFYNSVLAIDGIVQSVSIDEALIDITQICLEAGGSDGRGISEGSVYREQAKADEIGQELRASVKEKTDCAVSVGIGANILQAKVALRKAKPAGQFQLKPDDVLQFMGELAVRDLPGVGHSLSAKLEEISATLVKDMRDLSRERLVSALGPKTGIRMWEYARGIDKTEVGSEVIRKSVSAEVNWGIRFVNQDQAEKFITSLCGELNRRLVENLVKGKQLTLKVMRRSMDAPLEPVKHLGHGKCDTFNKSVAIGVATNATDIIAKEAILMLRSFNFSPGDLRGLGVQMTKLEPLKSGQASNVESSQRQLNFLKSPSRRRTSNMVEPGISPNFEMPQPEFKQTPSHALRSPADFPASQFIMPTQADPAIISELPSEIRSRLVAQSKPQEDARPVSPSPAPRQSVPVLPPQSQLDPEILLALPDDVREEVLGYYDKQSPVPDPPSPIIEAPAPPPVPVSRPLSSGNVGTKRPYSPPKRRRGRPPKFSRVDHRTQTLSNFVSRPAPVLPPTRQNAPRQPSPSLEPQLPPEVDAEFLAALPEDIRKEILEDQRRTRMLQQARANAPLTQTRPETAPETPVAPPPRRERKLALPPLPERPVFTSRRLSALPDLRQAVREWHSAFLDHGPYAEDVEVLSSYLGRVIVDEKDIDKSVSVVRWLMWLIDEDNVSRGPIDNQTPRSEQGFATWAEALDMLKNGIQTAMDARGMFPVDFD